LTCRAVHQLTDRPLIFEDPCALQIVGPAREQEIRNDPHRIGFKVLAGRLARVGEPFIGFFDPPELVAPVQHAGFSRVDDLSSSDLTSRFLSDRTDGLRLSGLGRILRARA